MNKPQILKDHKISKEIQLFLKEPQISKGTQITNEPQILKEDQISNEI